MIPRHKLPSCTDKSVCIKYDKNGNMTKIVKDTVIRHMTPEDMDTILENTPIGYTENLHYYHQLYGKRKARGLYMPPQHLIVLDPQYDMNEVLIHEAGHVFYGMFGAYEENNVKWTEKLFNDTRYIKVAQKHIVNTIPEDYHWEIKDIDPLYKNIENLC